MNSATTLTTTSGSQDVRVGMYFMRWKNHYQVDWYGQVLSSPRRGLYIIELFNGSACEPIEQRLVPIEKLVPAAFYMTKERFQAAAKHQELRERREALVDELRAASDPETGWLHGSAAYWIHSYLSDMRRAVEDNDHAEFERLAKLVRRKFERERSWYPSTPEEQAAAGAA